MSALGNHPKLRLFAIGLGCVVAGLGAYLFSTGPVCRWRPASAEKIFAPLNLFTELSLTRPLVRAWLTLWGVDPDRRHLIRLKGETGGYQTRGACADSHIIAFP